MKKLLTLSVLTATLASTAVFAQQMEVPKSSKGKPAMEKLGDQNAAPALLVSKKASQPTIVAFNIAQNLIDGLAGQDVKAKKAVIVFDKDGSPLKANIDLEKALTAKAVNALQEQMLATARFLNTQLSWGAIIVKPGNGNDIAKIYVISQGKDDTVKAVEVKLVDGRKKVQIIGTAVDQATAAKLLKAKKAADLAPVEGKPPLA